MKRRTKRSNAALSGKLIRRPIQRLFPIFLLPTFVAFCIGFIYPFGKGIYLSFCKFTTTSNAKWIGIGNYLKAFKDASFMHAFQYTALVAIVSLIVINLLAFTVAYAAHTRDQGLQHIPHGILYAKPHRRHRARLHLVDDIRRHPVPLRHIHCIEHHIRILGFDHPHGVAADRLYDDHLHRRIAIGARRLD
jgi:hypothetical protein